jgi:hypothetical protein
VRTAIDRSRPRIGEQPPHDRAAIALARKGEIRAVEARCDEEGHVGLDAGEDPALELVRISIVERHQDRIEDVQVASLRRPQHVDRRRPPRCGDVRAVGNRASERAAIGEALALGSGRGAGAELGELAPSFRQRDDERDRQRRRQRQPAAAGQPHPSPDRAAMAPQAVEQGERAER